MFVLAFGSFVSTTSMRIAEPLLADIATQFNTTVVDAASLITSFALAYGLFQLVHGPLGDRFGKLRVICVAVFLAAAASVACATSGSLKELTIYRFMSGMTIGAVIPLSLAFVGDNIAFTNRQQVMGKFIAGGLLGGIFGSLVGGLSGQYFGWRMSFLITASGFLLIGLLLLPRALKETHRAAGQLGMFGNMRALLKLRTVHVICAVVAIEGWLFYGAFSYMGAYLRHEHLLEYAVVGVVLAGFGCGGLLYSASVRQLVQRFGIVRMVVAGGVLMLLAFFGMSVSATWPVAFVLMFVLGLGFNLMHNTLQTQASEMAPDSRGSAIAIFAFSLFFGQAIGVVVDGQIVEWLGYRAMLLITGVCLMVLAAGFAWFLSQRTGATTG